MSASPEAVVQRQFEAYNAHDIDAFIATYSPGILVIEFPSGILLTIGRIAMRNDYEVYLRESNPHVDIQAQIVMGNKVIVHEKGSDLQRPSWEAAVIYEVLDGLIHRMWLV